MEFASTQNYGCIRDCGYVTGIWFYPALCFSYGSIHNYGCTQYYGSTLYYGSTRDYGSVTSGSMEPLVTCRTIVYGPVVLHVIDCPMKLSRVQPARSFTERRKIRYAKLIASQFVATGHELPLLNPTRLPNS